MRFWRLTGPLIAVIVLATACGGQETTGSLEIVIAGLPAGVAGSVAIEQPTGFVLTATASATYADLPAGTYVIAPASVFDGDDEYGAGGGQVNVAGGQTATFTVEYEHVPVQTGILRVTINAPAGVAPEVSITGPLGFDEFLETAGTHEQPVPAGTYEVAAATVTAGASTYAATGSGSYQVAPAGQTDITIDYDEVFLGRLAIAVSGLPYGLDAQIEVTGPGGFSETVATSTMLVDLEPGEYLITPPSVAVGGDILRSRIQRDVAVVADDTTSVAVNYSVPRVLVFVDHPGWTPSVGDHIAPGLAELGYDVELLVGFDADIAGTEGLRDFAEQLVAAGTYDLVMWFIQGYSSSGLPAASVIEDYLADDGRVVYSTWDGQWVDNQDLHAVLGAESGSEENLELAVMEHGAPGAAGGNVELVLESPQPGITFSRNLVPTAGVGESVCTYGNGGGNSCAVLANDGRSLWLGFIISAIADVEHGNAFYADVAQAMMDLGD